MCASQQARRVLHTSRTGRGSARRMKPGRILAPVFPTAKQRQGGNGDDCENRNAPSSILPSRIEPTTFWWQATRKVASSVLLSGIEPTNAPP